MEYELIESNSEKWLNLESLLNEEWKDIPEYDGFYQVSNYGRIKSLKFKNAKILKCGNNGNDYLFVYLCKNNKTNRYYIHRLVAMVFIKNTNICLEVNHKDENTKNNKLNNLEWCTSKYNANYGNRNKKMKDTKIKKYGKKVNQYNLNGEFIIQYESLSLIKDKYGFCPEAISNCCKGKSNTSYGYIWKFADE